MVSRPSRPLSPCSHGITSHFCLPQSPFLTLPTHHDHASAGGHQQGSHHHECAMHHGLRQQDCLPDVWLRCPRPEGAERQRPAAKPLCRAGASSWLKCVQDCGGVTWKILHAAATVQPCDDRVASSVRGRATMQPVIDFPVPESIRSMMAGCVPTPTRTAALGHWSEPPNGWPW